jgi:hypothetical protein
VNAVKGTSATSAWCFPATGTVLDQPFEGELPIPGSVPPEKVSGFQTVLMPLAATVTARARSTRLSQGT